MHHLSELLVDRIVSGLQRKSLTTPSRWAERYRIMGGKDFPGPWTFKHHPWLKEMHDSTAEENVGQKAAQMGYTECVLNITFYKIDIEGTDCLYVLPAKTPDASDFSAARFDPALELSPHLSKLFSDVKNIGHKRAGTTNLYIRGSKSRAGLKSVPVGFLVLDEVDEMDQSNIALATERTSGQITKQKWKISTPTVEIFGINRAYQDSTQEHFFFKCPKCSKFTELIFPQCLIITAYDLSDQDVSKSHLICKECKGILNHKEKISWLSKNEWVPEHSDRDIRGFHINQLYSSTVTPVELAKSYLKAQQDPTEEQEFWNSKLGLPHMVEGSRITDAQIKACIAEPGYKRKQLQPRGIITLGIDVGKWIHYEVDQWSLPSMHIATTDLNVMSQPKVLDFGKVLNFDELDEVMMKNRVMSAVIDANPERRKAYEFASKWWGHVKMCFYGQGVQGKQIHIGKDQEPTITVDRTSWLDLSLGRFRNKTIILPIDIDQEFQRHLKALVRVYDKDANGNPVGRYVTGNEEDHYAHARNYAEIALQFALILVSPTDIRSPT